MIKSVLLFSASLVSKVKMSVQHCFIMLFVLLLLGCGSDSDSEDTTPASFIFTSVDDAMLSTQIQSAAITVQGINVETDISISGGEYSVDSGTFTASQGVINNGQQVIVRSLSADLFNTPTVVELTIGGVTGSFTITTRDIDVTPDDFSFIAAVDTELNSFVVSNAVTINGIDSATSIVVSEGEFSVDGGEFVTASGAISNGQSIRLRVESSSEFLTSRTAELTVGIVTETFTVTTRAFDETPDSFGFPSVVDAELSQLVVSAPTAINGIDDATSVSISEGEYSIDEGDFLASSGSINKGQSIRVRLMSSDALAMEQSAALTVGTVTEVFSVTTREDIIAPTANILFPPPRSLTRGETIFVRGTTEDASRVDVVEVNGVSAEPTGPNGSFQTWQVSVPLEDGDNTLVVLARDVLNNENDNAASVNIRSDSSRPFELFFPDSNSDFRNLTSLALDRLNNRVFVADGVGISSARLVAVDLATGERDIFTTYSAGNVMSNNLLVDDVNERAFWSVNQTIFSLDLATGERTVISDNETPNADFPFSLIRNIILDPNDEQTLLVADETGILRVSVETGQRTVFSSGRASRGLVPNDINDFVSVTGLVYDAEANRILANDANRILIVDTQTGARSVLSDNDIFASSALFFDNTSIALDTDRNRLLVANGGGELRNGLLAVDLTTGMPSAFSAFVVPNTTNAPSNYTDVIHDQSLGYALTVDAGAFALVAIDIVSGNRVFVSLGSLSRGE